MRDPLRQSQRAISLLIDVLVLLLVSYFAFGGFMPPTGDKGFWFYTALLSVLLGTKLATPFYVKPVDAVAYSIPALVALMLTNSWELWSIEARVSYAFAVAIAAISGVVAFAALVFNDWGVKELQNISNRARLLAEGLANPSVIYSPMMIFSMLAFHYEVPRELVAIAIAMLLTTTFSFGDILIKGIVRFRRFFSGSTALDGFGSVVAYQKPGIYLLRAEQLDEVKLPTPILVHDDLTGFRAAYAIDIVGRDGGHLCRAVELGPINDAKVLQYAQGVAKNTSTIADDAILKGADQATIELYSRGQAITGLVAQDTAVGRLYFEVARNEGLSVGRLVSVEFGGQKVLYQIVAGLTREEPVHNKNTYGYLRAQAQQIGIWRDEKFVQCRWLPVMHTPVKLIAQEAYAMRPQTIGRFPQTNYTAEIQNIHQLVTHNTAILGILGVGKSMLAIELVERMLAEGIKVICLDLTNQYAQELQDYYCEEIEAESLGRIQDACVQDRDAAQDNPEEGGSIPNLKRAISADLMHFLSEENPQRLKIYNPSSFVATRQDHEPRNYQARGQWHRTAGLYTVTPVEATQIVSEAALACVSDRMTDRARVCLVYEEAHALVPEWNSVVVEGDKKATAGTARAILQGRKYGLGCLLITQRTANVTKTILNQCNTIFAMRTFDETGKEFLANYIGSEYSDELSSLPERHAVFFGRASNCENPVLIALNNREQFLDVFRREFPPPDRATLCGGHEFIVGEAQAPDTDVPF